MGVSVAMVLEGKFDKEERKGQDIKGMTGKDKEKVEEKEEEERGCGHMEGEWEWVAVR